MKTITLLIMQLLAIATQSSFYLELSPLLKDATDYGNGYWQEAVDKTSIKKECSRYSLKKAIESNKSIDQFVLNCESDMIKNSKFSSLLSFLKMKIYPDNEDRYQMIDLHIGRGEVVQGILALKESETPLPLVIIKAGTFSNASITSSGKAVFMHYFQESPFHVLYLESTSGDHFMKVNKKAFLGGLAEGAHLIEAIQAFEGSELKGLISEYHLGGISLGGSSVLFASIYAEKLVGRAKPKSITAICPVVSVEETMIPLFNNFFTGTPLVPYFSKFLEDVWPYTENLQLEFPSIDFETLDANDHMRIIRDGSLAYYKSLKRGDIVSSIVDVSDVKKGSYSYYNNYMNFYQKTKLPTYIMHAVNDSVVDYSANLGSLRAVLESDPNQYIHPITFSGGNHCAYNQVYGTETLTTILRGVILKHSSLTEKTSSIDLEREIDQWRTPLLKISRLKLAKGEVISRYNFVSINNEGKARLQFKIFNPNMDRRTSNNAKCDSNDYSNSHPSCYRTVGGLIDLSTLDLNISHTEMGRNIALRILNTNGVIKGASGREVIGESEMPTVFTLSNWD